MSKRWTIQDVERLKSGVNLHDSKNAESVDGHAKKKEAIKSRVKLHDQKVGANALTAHALRILDLKGFHVWRQNNGGVYDPVKKVFRANSSTPGIPDILGFHRKTGVIIACEIKAGRDTLSDEQEAFLQAVRDAGGIALVIRTMDDIEDIASS